MSLLDVIDSFATDGGNSDGTYKVNRTVAANPPYDSHGRAVVGTASTFNIVACVQPLSGRDLMVLPEAQRAEETQWLDTATRLYTRSETTAPDEVVIPNDEGVNESWVVIYVDRRVLDGDTHYRCRIARRATP